MIELASSFHTISSQASGAAGFASSTAEMGGPGYY